LRFAIYSDIHSNQESLEAVLADIEYQKVDKHLCLGDIVGYGANPNECIEMVKKDSHIFIAGNHDHAAVGLLGTGKFNAFAQIAMEYTKKVLDKNNYGYIQSAPLLEKMENATLVHASPKNPSEWSYLTTIDSITECFNYFETPFCFVGHTHVPYLILRDSDHPADLLNQSEFQLKKGQKCIVNTGSVGQPRDRNPKASYVIYDSDEGSVQIKRVSYDILTAQDKMKKAKLPEFLINRIAQGR
jgi:diadenosine tetraphosphatase ApaH/serine/threonine PP2A family protein phosphatase